MIQIKERATISMDTMDQHSRVLPLLKVEQMTYLNISSKILDSEELMMTFSPQYLVREREESQVGLAVGLEGSVALVHSEDWVIRSSLVDWELSLLQVFHHLLLDLAICQANPPKQSLKLCKNQIIQQR